MYSSDENKPLSQDEITSETLSAEATQKDSEHTETIPSETQQEEITCSIAFESTDTVTPDPISPKQPYGYTPSVFQESPPTPPPAPKKKPTDGKTLVITLMSLSILMFVLSCILCITALDKQSPSHAIGTRPARTDILEPWVNPTGLDSADSYAVATAKVIDSVVVITTDISSGSGVIWASHDEFSYILTCYHVIESAEIIKVTLNSNDVYAAVVVGGDARTDLAILRIDQPNLPAIVLPSEDHSLALGQAVIAIGNPLGTLGNSVTNGILSSLTRTLTIDGYTMELMQTNAAVNQGNSGGGLFDLNGQLIGLVNAKSSGTSVEGIGFAIPYTTLKSIASELVEKGYVSGRPRLGITLVTINSAESYRAAILEHPDLESIITQKGMFGSSYRAGIYIVDTSLVKGYAEGSSSLQFGDRLTAINGVTITGFSDISTVLNNCAAGDTVQITVVRQNKTVSVEVILGEVGE